MVPIEWVSFNKEIRQMEPDRRLSKTVSVGSLIRRLHKRSQFFD